MAGGQVLDLKSHDQKRDIAYLKKTHLLKTGMILKSCITLPSILYEVSLADQEFFETIGNQIGLLFQITDDILDVEGTKEQLGKSPLKDRQSNKLTYTTLLSLEKAKEHAQNIANEALQVLEDTPQYQTDLIKSFIIYLLSRQS